ncbi:hypothetical protein LYNGBM3L_15330 [Moorena producens 3L]|uniref:Restriction endonuclease domain-containing protein n=1 Tax=Moorena producens 3L TaxID=489825 RepID=F4XLP3_9CYAN|nr:hypothetical protein LYNGBM3L_15330 [Moorena producens 3L]
MNTLPINIPPSLRVTDEQFEQLASANRDLRLERSATGKLIVMPPTGGNTGKRNIDIEGQLWYGIAKPNWGLLLTPLLLFDFPIGQFVLLMQLGLLKNDGMH